MKSVVDSNMHFITNEAGQEELYDLSADPEENRDLSRSASAADELIRGRRLLVEAARVGEKP